MKSKSRQSNKPEGWINSGWKVPIHLTCKQEKYAWRAMGVARFAYNLALFTHQFHRRNRLKWASVNDMQKAFNACKREDYPFVLNVSKYVAEGGFLDFEKALNNWRNPKIPARCPKPKKKKGTGNGAFLAGYNLNNVKYDGKKQLRLPFMGSVKLIAPLPAQYIPHEARIVRENGRWYVSLQGYRTLPEAPETQAVVGVDVGINPLAAIYSEGSEETTEMVENPRAYYKAQRKLRRWQRALARRTKGSRGWHEATRRIEKQYRRMNGARNNAQHQLSSKLVKEYSCIGIESLRVKGLFKNHNLSKALADAALSKLLWRVRYKAGWYRRELVLADTFYPSTKTCFDCGNVNRDLTLKDKRWTCPVCGVTHNRDANAARNLHKLALLAGRKEVKLLDEEALAGGCKAFSGTFPVEGRPQTNAAYGAL